MSRGTWTIGVGIIGFAIAWHGQGVRLEPEEVLIGTVWGACIGYGFGNIFDKRHSGKRVLVFYWAATLALTAAFFLPFVPVSSFPARVAIAATMGVVLGAGIGLLQLARSRHAEVQPVNK